MGLGVLDDRKLEHVPGKIAFTCSDQTRSRPGVSLTGFHFGGDQAP